jgi:hypothetical protein
MNSRFKETNGRMKSAPAKRDGRLIRFPYSGNLVKYSEASVSSSGSGRDMFSQRPLCLERSRQVGRVGGELNRSIYEQL